MVGVFPSRIGRWVVAASLLPTALIHGCSRALFNKYSDKIVLTGRSMDWSFSFEDLLFVYPRGVDMDGGTGEGAIPAKWTSKYGSVVSSIIGYAEKFGYDFEKDGGTDGINEVGLAAHGLYLGETKYTEPNSGGRKNITYMRWLRYILDNFATVSEAVDGLKNVNIVSVPLGGHVLGCHMAIEDATGDSAVFEVIDGMLKTYHGKDVLIMTNDPPLNEQQALLKQYVGFGGDLPLPGSTSSEDRFVRLSFFLPFLKEPEDDVQAVAKVQSLMMNSNVPFDAPDGYDTNSIYPSWWNSYCDMTNLVYYFSWLETPFMLWMELEDFDFAPGKDILVLDPKVPTINGDVSSLFKNTGDFRSEGTGGNIHKAALLESSFFQSPNAKEGNANQARLFTTFFAAFIGSVIGFFVHNFMTVMGRNHYHPIAEV